MEGDSLRGVGRAVVCGEILKNACAYLVKKAPKPLLDKRLVEIIGVAASVGGVAVA
jgi:hypothetical protein